MTFIKRSDEYWERRAEEQLTLIEQQSLKHLKDIDKVYLQARRNNLDAVKRLYLAYFTKQGFDTQSLRLLAPQGDIRRFKQAVVDAGLSSELPEGYKFRLNRLELLEAQMWVEAKQAALKHGAIQTLAHRETVQTAYYYAMYNLSKGTGVAPVFAQLNTRAINQILNTKFYGKNYSQRIWNNSTKLARELKKDLASATASGQSYSRTAQLIREKHDVTRYEASRLIRTETNRFNTLASIESYESAGLDEVVFVATLDGRTSQICQDHDGKRYKTDDTANLPPLHPNERSTTRAWLGEEYEPDERIMRDPVTGKNRIITNLSYKQWQELYL